MELFRLVGGGVGGGGAGTNKLAEAGQSAIGRVAAAVDEEALFFRFAITAAATCCLSQCMSHASKCRAVIGGPCAFSSMSWW